MSAIRKLPLACMVAGTMAYVCILSCGCTTASKDLAYDGAHPLIRFSNNGMLFSDELVTPARAVELLEENHIPHDATIHLLVDDDYTDRRSTWVFQHNYLARAGYNRSVLVTKRKATSKVVEGSQATGVQKSPAKPKIRYKKANE